MEVGSSGGLRRKICHVVPFVGFQIGASVLLKPVGEGAPTRGLGLGEDESDVERKWRRRGRPMAMATSTMHGMMVIVIHPHARRESVNRSFFLLGPEEEDQVLIHAEQWKCGRSGRPADRTRNRRGRKPNQGHESRVVAWLL